IASFYLKYRNLSVFQSVLATLRPAVVAMIAAAGVSILTTAFWGSKTAITLRSTHWSLVSIFIISAVLLQKYKLNPILVMILAGIMNTGLSFIQGVLL
ncbi:MAG: chromate transporter, partial [Clostridiaceae bacterium]|nr:chromate transporter [Clostridiaceae bacterium]